MLYLYLLVLLVSLIGLGVVVMEWSRGVREGLIGAFSTFLVALSIAALALAWLHDLDRQGRSLAPATIKGPAAPLESDEGVSEERGRVSPSSSPRFPWRRWLTTGQVGLALTALSLFAQVTSILSARHRDRNRTLTIDHLQRTHWEIHGIRRSLEDLQRRIP